MQPCIDLFRLVFSLFESDDRRLALLSPIKFIAYATSMQFQGWGQVPVSADYVTLLLRGASILSEGLHFLIIQLTLLLFCGGGKLGGQGQSPVVGGVSGCSYGTPNPPSLGEGAVVTKGESKVIGYIFLCQLSMSAYQENLTRFEDRSRLWLKTSPKMPFARV